MFDKISFNGRQIKPVDILLYYKNVINPPDLL